jgi:hypothetical protein
VPFWRSRAGAAPNIAGFDRNDAEAVRRRRATANRVLTYLKSALNHACSSACRDPTRKGKKFIRGPSPVHAAS